MPTGRVDVPAFDRTVAEVAMQGRRFGGDKVLNRGSKPKRSSNLGETYAAGAEWAMGRVKDMPRASKLYFRSPAEEIILTTASGMEAALRDAFAAGAAWTWKEGS